MGSHQLVDTHPGRFPDTLGATRSLIAALALIAACPACQGRSEAPPAPDVAAPEVRLEGQVRFADRWTKVAPSILHDAKMDLATRCRLLQGEAGGDGAAAPLCFSPERRPAQAITAIRVERDEALPRAMHRLTRDNEGAHFVIDRTGGIYQVLDLALAARRGGVYQEGEVRVIACQAAAEQALVAALRSLYPAATVTTIPSPGANP